MGDHVGYRISDWDTPLRANPNRSPGRYNRANDPATQYIGLHPLTPWAEYLRFHGLRRVDDVADRRLSIWALRLSLEEAVEIRFENAPDFGLQAGDLVSDDHGACQDFADRVRAEAGMPATFIVPSAALPGTRNVVIFGERVDIPYLWEPLDEGDLPTCVVAARARPPDRLLTMVRHPGEPHSELDAWAAGRRYRFADLR